MCTLRFPLSPTSMSRSPLSLHPPGAPPRRPCGSRYLCRCPRGCCWICWIRCCPCCLCWLCYCPCCLCWLCWSLPPLNFPHSPNFPLIPLPPDFPVIKIQHQSGGLPHHQLHSTQRQPVTMKIFNVST